MKPALYTYATPPVDFWDGWVPLPAFVRRLVGLEMAGVQVITIHEFLAFLLQAAHAVATQPNHHWEGDVRGGHGIAPEDRDDTNMYIALRDGQFPVVLSEVVIAWKKDNNGVTYFVS